MKRTHDSSADWHRQRQRRELRLAILLGLACALLVAAGMVLLYWREILAHAGWKP